MRPTWFVPLFVACTADDPDCGSGRHEEDGACVADPTDGTTTPEIGNDVDLDSFPPVVVRTLPANGALDVDPALTALEVEFSRPMEVGQNYAWWTVDAFDSVGGTPVWTDNRTNVYPDHVLEPDRAYHLYVNDPFGDGDSFHAPDGRSALEYPFVFATGDDPALLADFEAAVVASSPVAGTEDVDPALARVEVTFGKDMDPSLSDWAKDTRETFPEIVTTGFSDPRTAWADVALEPSTTYAIRIDGFVDTDGNDAAPWLLTFRTADP